MIVKDIDKLWVNFESYGLDCEVTIREKNKVQHKKLYEGIAGNLIFTNLIHKQIESFHITVDKNGKGHLLIILKGYYKGV